MRRGEVTLVCQAALLLWAFEAHGSRRGIDPNTVKGANELRELALTMTATEWADLARKAGVEPPIPILARLVRMMLRTKASFLFNQPPEKSARYSQAPGRVEVLP